MSKTPKPPTKPPAIQRKPADPTVAPGDPARFVAEEDEVEPLFPVGTTDDRAMTYRKAYEEGLDAGRPTSRLDRVLQGGATAAVLAVALFLPVRWYWKIAVFLVCMFLLGVLIPVVKRSRQSKQTP